MLAQLRSHTWEKSMVNRDAFLSLCICWQLTRQWQSDSKVQLLLSKEQSPTNNERGPLVWTSGNKKTTIICRTKVENVRARTAESWAKTAELQSSSVQQRWPSLPFRIYLSAFSVGKTKSLIGPVSAAVGSSFFTIGRSLSLEKSMINQTKGNREIER